MIRAMPRRPDVFAYGIGRSEDRDGSDAADWTIRDRGGPEARDRTIEDRGGSDARIRMITEPSLPRARGARYLTGLPETMRPAVYCESNQTEQPDERGCYEDA